MSTVPAWASTTSQCIVCHNMFTTARSTDSTSYEDVYNIQHIDGLEDVGAGLAYEEIVDVDDGGSQGAILRAVNYNGNPICRNCLETKISEYKANIVQTTQTGSTNINASIDSHYTLVVPESVTMTGEDNVDEKTATIPVTVKGNICEDECVTVATNVTAMQRAGSKDATATVTAPKTVWNYGDVTASNKEGTTSNYIVKATLSPGDWKGVATFTCTLGNAA